MASATPGYLPGRRGSPPFDRYQIILLGEQRHMCVNNLPKIVTWQCPDLKSILGPFGHQSHSLLSHHQATQKIYYHIMPSNISINMLNNVWETSNARTDWGNVSCAKTCTSWTVQWRCQAEEWWCPKHNVHCHHDNQSTSTFINRSPYCTALFQKQQVICDITQSPSLQSETNQFEFKSDDFNKRR